MLALGAAGHMGLGAGIALEEDPRAAEVDLYWLASIVDHPDTTLVWLDRSSSDFESRFEACQHGPMNVRVILAVKDADDLTRKRLNDLMVLGTLSTASCYCEYIDSRFQNGTEWAAYLRGLPKTRPKDLFIRITVDGVTSTVREGEVRLHTAMATCTWQECSPQGSLANCHNWQLHENITPSQRRC